MWYVVIGLAAGLLAGRIGLRPLSPLARRHGGRMRWLLAAAAVAGGYRVFESGLAFYLAYIDRVELGASLVQWCGYLAFAAGIASCRSREDVVGTAAAFIVLGPVAALAYATIAQFPDSILHVWLLVPLRNAVAVVRSPGPAPLRAQTATTPWRRPVALAAAAGVVLAFVARLAVLPTGPLRGDAAWYYQAGSTLLETHEYLMPTCIHQPATRLARAERGIGYPLLVAGCIATGRAVGVDPVVVVRVLQVVLSVAALAPLYLMATALSGPWAGLLAVVLYALYDPIVGYSHALLTEALGWHLGLAVGCLSMAVPRRGRLATSGAAGLLAAAATIVRAPSISLFAGAVLHAAFRSRRDAAAVALAFAIGLAPWVIRNTVVLGAPVALGTGGGFSFWAGNYLPYGGRVVAGTYEMAEVLTRDCRDEVQIDRAFKSAGRGLVLDNVIASPVAFAALLLEKVTVLAWSAPSDRQWATVLHRAILVFALLGAPATTKRSAVLWGTAIALLAVHAASYAMEPRYFLPAMPLLTALAAAGVVEVLCRRSGAQGHEASGDTAGPDDPAA